MTDVSRGYVMKLLNSAAAGAGGDQHYLYVASPGTRNYVEYGGVGVLVFDIDHGYKFVKRIATWKTPEGKEPENVKGIAASAQTGRIYITSLNHMIAIDAITGKTTWDKTCEGGCDRMAIFRRRKSRCSPNGSGAAPSGERNSTGDYASGLSLL
jgi:hypothetical protein